MQYRSPFANARCVYRILSFYWLMYLDRLEFVDWFEYLSWLDCLKDLVVLTDLNVLSFTKWLDGVEISYRPELLGRPEIVDIPEFLDRPEFLDSLGPLSRLKLLTDFSFWNLQRINFQCNIYRVSQNECYFCQALSFDLGMGVFRGKK